MDATQPGRMAEDYLTLVWKAYEWPGDRPTTTDLASRLGVTPSTVSANLKKLARDGYLEYEAYGPIRLTPAGERIATRMVRRHRLIETYLVTRLGFGWDEVHDEADRLEHATSDLLLDRMAEALGHPAVDPHGDPIPAADGTVARPDTRPLDEVAAGERVRVARVSDRHPEVLRYLAEKGVTVGAEIEVVHPAAAHGALTIRIEGTETELTATAADAVRVAIPMAE
jgi:DtxR family transcriptional regulator, Mn-dependent transcriptional regulator